MTGSQEYKLKRGDTAVDPASDRGWTVWAVDDKHGTIDLKVTQAYAGPSQAALVEDSPVNTKVLAERLCDLGDRVVREGVTGRDAGTALLLRLRPDDGDGRSGPLRGDDEAVTDAAVRLVLSLRGSCLPIQGPPGTGKTFTAAGQILELIKAGRTAASSAPRTPSSTTCSARSPHAPTSWVWPARASASAPTRTRRTCIRERQAWGTGLWRPDYGTGTCT